MRRIFSITLAITLLTACTGGSQANAVGNTSSSSSVRSSAPFKRFSSKSSTATLPVTPPKTWKIPILVYHHIRKQEGWSKATWSWKMTVSPSIFEKHMQWLVDHQYTTITLDDFVAMTKGEIPMPAKPIVITFDDNNLNAYENAVPILVKNKQVAVFYQVSNRLQNPQTIDTTRTKDLVSKGMDIQSHTVTHSTMTNLSLTKLDTELLDSKKTLEALTGKPIRHIAYPNTTQNKTVREHTKAAGYVTGTIMDPRFATEKDDFFKLPRIMITDDTSMAKLLP